MLLRSTAVGGKREASSDKHDHDGCDEMKRFLLIGFSVCLLCGAACDRSQVATAILTAGFSKPASESAENPWHAGLAPAESIQPVDNLTALTPLDAVWLDLRNLREQNSDREGTVAQETIDVLLHRTDSLIADYEGTAAESQLHSARDAKLTLLSIGANIKSAEYAARRDRFYRELFQAEYDSHTAANASVQRFVTEHLAKAEIDSHTAEALARHVTAHPDCDMNVQLYMTTVERLANEGQLATALQTGTQGLSLCASHAAVAGLEAELNRLRAENPGVPGTTMQFTSPTLRGQRFDLSSMRGKPVLVVFWATWCPACVKETPNIKSCYQRFHGEGLEVVGVSLDVDREKLAGFVNEQQLPWPQMFSNHPGNEAWNNPIAKYYDVQSIPQAFLLDENGTIVAGHLQRRSQIESAILRQLSR